MTEVSVVIPAYNEEGRIGDVVSEIPEEYEVLVVDDDSQDGTIEEAKKEGAEIVQNRGGGYINGIRTGFEEAESEIIVTMDGDGEHKPEDVEKLVKPVKNGDYDLVFGRRKEIPRPSERFLSWLVRPKVGVRDSGTGFRALTKQLAQKLNLGTTCTCGTFALEAKQKGAEIGEVPAETKDIDKERTVAWDHLYQFFHVIWYLVKT